MCPGPRLTTIEAWIKYLESKQNISSNDIIQLPLHMLDDEFSEEQDEIKYSRRSRLENDVQSLVKVRQVCMFDVLLVWLVREITQLNCYCAHLLLL